MLRLAAIQEAHKVSMDAMASICGVLHDYYPSGSKAVPRSRADYIRLIESFDINTRFYPMCARGCPCSVKHTHCPSCGDELKRPDGKYKRLFFLRDPVLHDQRLRDAGAPFAYGRTIRTEPREVGVLRDLYHGATAERLMRPAPCAYAPTCDRGGAPRDAVTALWYVKGFVLPALMHTADFKFRDGERDTVRLNQETNKYAEDTKRFRTHPLRVRR